MAALSSAETEPESTLNTIALSGERLKGSGLCSIGNGCELSAHDYVGGSRSKRPVVKSMDMIPCC